MPLSYESHRKTGSVADFKALTKLDALHSLKIELNKLLLTASTNDSIVSYKNIQLLILLKNIFSQLCLV
jgi:hypothetical protein